MIINKILKNNEKLAKEEEDLRQNIGHLEKEAKKKFYRLNEKKALDPDTYSAIHWILYVGGFHNLYLKEYLTFFIEFSIGLIGYILLFSGVESALFVLIGLYLIELPALFFSQKIVQVKNHEISLSIYNKINDEIEKEKIEQINNENTVDESITIENE